NTGANTKKDTRGVSGAAAPSSAGRYPEVLRSVPRLSAIDQDPRAPGKALSKKKNLAPVPDKYNCSTDEFEPDPKLKSSASRTNVSQSRSSVSQSRTNESQGIWKVRALGDLDSTTS